MNSIILFFLFILSLVLILIATPELKLVLILEIIRSISGIFASIAVIYLTKR